MSKARKLYILLAIAMPVAVAMVVLAWAAGNLIAIIFITAAPVSWTFLILAKVRKLSRRQKVDITRHTTNRISPLRRKIILERIFWLLILASSVTFLVIGLVSDAVLYRILGTVWFIIISGGHLLFVPLLTDR